MPLKLNSVVAGTSFTGTASLATQAVSASYAELAATASFLSGSIESASYAATASLAITASYLSGSIESASYAASASLAMTASYVSGAVNLNSSNFFYGLQYFGPEEPSSSLGGIALTGSEGIEMPSIYFFSSSQSGMVRKDARISAETPSQGGDLSIRLSSNAQTIGTFNRSTSSLEAEILDLTRVTRVSGSNFLGTFTGSFSGSITSASFSDSASVAISASVALTASYLSGSVETASFAFTSSLSDTASFAFTSSYLSGSAETASFALTASYLSGSAETASFAFTASYLSGSAETASFAFTASYLSGSVETASFAFTASYLSGSVDSASYAATASYALTASYLSGSVNAFPYSGSAEISGSLRISKDFGPSGVAGANTYLMAGDNLKLTSGSIALGFWNRTGSYLSPNNSTIVIGAGITSPGQNIFDYRASPSDAGIFSPPQLIIGDKDTAMYFENFVTRFVASGSDRIGYVIFQDNVSTEFQGSVTASADISSSKTIISENIFANSFTASIATGSFTGSFSGSLRGTWNNSGSHTFLHTGSSDVVQTFTGSLNFLGNLTVQGTASFTSVTASSVLVNQNTITVYANSTASLPKAGYLAVDTASISSSGSLLYDVTAQRWESDRNFYAPAISSSNTVYIGNGTADETFRIRASGSGLYFEIFDGTDWNSMGHMVR